MTLLSFGEGNVYDCSINGKYISFYDLDGVYDLPSLFTKCPKCKTHVCDCKKVCGECLFVTECDHLQTQGTVICEDYIGRGFYFYIDRCYQKVIKVAEDTEGWNSDNKEWYIEDGCAVMMKSQRRYDLFGRNAKKAFLFGSVYDSENEE
jgi:hypothetical protein